MASLFADVTAKVLNILATKDLPTRIFPKSGSAPYAIDVLFRRDQVGDETSQGTVAISIGMVTARYATHLYPVKRGDELEYDAARYRVQDIVEDGLGQATMILARGDGPAR